MDCGAHRYSELEAWPPTACSNCGGIALLPLADQTVTTRSAA
jgi:hypothetical protein